MLLFDSCTAAAAGRPRPGSIGRRRSGSSVDLSRSHRWRPHTTGCRPCAGAPIRPPSIRQAIHLFDKETIAELPQAAQDRILTARGERTSRFRSDTEAAASPEVVVAAANELEALLERGDVVEAAFVYDRTFAKQDLDRGPPKAGIARTFLWRAGRWRDATKDLRQQRTLEPLDDASFNDRSPLSALADLEMWAEMQFARLVRTL